MSMKKKMVGDDSRALLSCSQDKELDPLQEAILETHLQSCESCAKEWLLLNRLNDRLKQLPAVDPGPYFTSQVMGKVLETERVPTLSTAVLRWLYSLVFVVFLVLGVLANSGFSLFHFHVRTGPDQAPAEKVVNLLVESQDLSLLNVQDTTVALLVKGKGENNEP